MTHVKESNVGSDDGKKHGLRRRLPSVVFVMQLKTRAYRVHGHGVRSKIERRTKGKKETRARAYKLVRKYSDTETCWQLLNYFTWLQHEKQPRNNQFK